MRQVSKIGLVGAMLKITWSFYLVVQLLGVIVGLNKATRWGLYIVE
jgi:hypothetical protein